MKLVVAAILALVLCSGEKNISADQFDKKIFTDGKDTLPYRLLHPIHEKTGEKYPLLIYLHGAGGRGHDNELHISKLHEALTKGTHLAAHPCYLFVPQCNEYNAWVWFPGFPQSLASADTPSTPARLTLAAIHQLIKEKNIDPARIYLTGFSLGGEGTFDLLTREPDLFACGVPLASVADTAKAKLIKDIPIWAFHGTDDAVSGIKYTRMMIDAIKKHGGHPRFTEVPHIGHDCRVAAYTDPELWEWMFFSKEEMSSSCELLAHFC